MTEPVFVDTNVLVYRHDNRDPEKRFRADEWLTLLIRRRAGRISFQVLQELYATLTRKLEPRLEPPEAQEIARELSQWGPVVIDLALIERAWRLQERYSLSWWDALIVAAAQGSRCRALLTEDLQPGQLFGTVRVIDPFASPERTPAELLAAADPG